MPDLMDKIYCSEQIHIPPTFPYIMKLYCKAAIRTQPYDLLKWSAAYFRALANGEEPPVKERVEFPPYDSPSGITPGFIKILINQLGKDPETMIPAQDLFKKWTDICLEEHQLIKLIALLGATTQINWVKFVGLCAGFISKTLTHTMILICELFTDEPEGGMATVPYALFVDLYMFLAQIECGPLTEKDLEDQEAEEQEKEICEVVEKIKEGLYEDDEEHLGEVEDNVLIGEDTGGKSTETSTAAEEVVVEEEEETSSRTEVDTRSSSRSKKKRGTSIKSNIADEQEGEDEELENLSVTALSAPPSGKVSHSSTSIPSDEKDETSKSEKKKSKETEGEADKEADGKSVNEEKYFGDRRRTTFRDLSATKDSEEEEKDSETVSTQQRRTTEETNTRGRSTVSTHVSQPRPTVDSSAQPTSGRSTIARSTIQDRESYVKEMHEKETIIREEYQRRKSTVPIQSVYRKYTSDQTGIIGSKKFGKIDLDQLEDTIRAKIEAKLAEENEIMDEEEKELKDLSTFLDANPPTVKKITINNLGYKIFKKYMRQDVPGIGPYIETSQVEKVVDYMDYWSNKQNGMVMPRNIRHWMCPPLDKLPATEP